MKKQLYSIIFFFIISLPGSQSQDPDWLVFRGKSDLTGSTTIELTSQPVLLWSYAGGTPAKSSPVISNNVIFFGDDKGFLSAVGSDGKIIWKYDAGSPIEAPPLVYADYVVAGTSDGRLTAVNKLTAKPVWSYSSDNQIVGSANVWIAGKKSGIIFGSYDYYLHCVESASGKLLWKLETDNYVNGTPAVANNRIVFGGCDGVIRVTDPLTGMERDTINIGIYIAASPALFDQKAYLVTMTGTFTASILLIER